jgi:hypothetical protein
MAQRHGHGEGDNDPSRESQHPSYRQVRWLSADSPHRFADPNRLSSTASSRPTSRTGLTRILAIRVEICPAGRSQNAPTAKLCRPRTAAAGQVAGRSVEILLAAAAASDRDPPGRSTGTGFYGRTVTVRAIRQSRPIFTIVPKASWGILGSPLGQDGIPLPARPRLRSWGRQGAQGAYSAMLRTAAISQTSLNRRTDFIQFIQFDMHHLRRLDATCLSPGHAHSINHRTPFV